MLGRTVVVVAIVLTTLPIRASGEEAAITSAEVEVRGGPSLRFPVTGVLRAGHRVEVLGTEGDFLKITPPEGSFSLIARDAVQRRGDAGLVAKEGVESLVAGVDGKPTSTRGVPLPRGAQVIIVGEVMENGEAFYRIQPHAGELRFIPASAVSRQEVVRTHGEPSALVQGSDPIETMLRQADEAYRAAESTGNWEHPRKLYEELSRCPHHEARMLAWNRLEFIRTKSRGTSPIAPASAVSRTPASLTSSTGATRTRTAPAAVMGRPAPAFDRAPPRAASTYSYTTDPGPGRSTWTPTGSAATAAPAAQAREARAEGTTQAAGSNAAILGRLQRARQTADGKPLYYLEGSRGELRCYVTPATGLSLDAFLDRIVELRGTSYAYRGDLRGWHLAAVQVTPVQ